MNHSDIVSLLWYFLIGISWLTFVEKIDSYLEDPLLYKFGLIKRIYIVFTWPICVFQFLKGILENIINNLNENESNNSQR